MITHATLARLVFLWYVFLWYVLCGTWARAISVTHEAVVSRRLFPIKFPVCVTTPVLSRLYNEVPISSQSRVHEMWTSYKYIIMCLAQMAAIHLSRNG